MATSISLSAGEWIVPEKRLSAAATLSDEVRALIAGIGPPDYEKMANIKPRSREELRQFVDMMNAANPMTMEGHETTFGVQIESSEMAGVTVHTVLPGVIDPAFKGKIFVHIHGGGYFIGSGAQAALEASIIASTAGIKVLSVDYALSTEKPFPAALNDVVAVYGELLKTVPASAIGMGGTSAGGGLALATVHQLKNLDLPVPGALFAGTPSVDLLQTGDTWTTNEGVDNILVTGNGLLRSAFLLYAAGEDMTNPLISPLYGDFSDFPPTYLVSGTRDMLLSDTVRVHRKLREAGVIADLNVFEGLPHGAYVGVPGSREYNGTFFDLKDFLATHLTVNR
jgi:epsilon-lactone hydrolase